MSLASELTKAVDGGDTERVRDLIIEANEKERRTAADDMERLLISRDGRKSLAPLAFLGTATARNVTTWSWAASEAAQFDVVGDVLAARGKAYLETLLRALEREDVQLWRLVRVAVRAGWSPSPNKKAGFAG